MDEHLKGPHIATVISGLFVIITLVLMLKVCSYCYPEMRENLETVFAGLEESPVREAFSTFADGLEDGEPLRDTITETAQVLLGRAD